jgi:hypothetical protein
MNEPSLSIRALLDRNTVSKVEEPKTSQEEDEYAALAGGRIGNRPQWTLVVEHADGAVRGFPYAQFDGIRAHDPTQGFTIAFADCEVTIEGRNLTRLFNRVCEHRVATIVEAPRSRGLLAEDDEPIVWSIQYRPRRDAPTLPS